MIFSPFRARLSAWAKAGRLAVVAAAGALALGVAMPAFVPGAAMAQGVSGAAAAQKIADHFSAVRTMTGEFVQFGPKGEQTGGTFYIERPGKIRFNYNNSPIRVISDGNQVVINNRKLDTWDLYALSTTPLNMLLADRINLGGGRLQSVKQEPDMTTLVVGDKSMFGNSTITMMFDPNNFELKQWTITDAQNLDTTVMVFNLRTGVRFTDDMFKIDYKRIATKTKQR
ncbi:outer membrane lipoprotein carrier protein LolA [Falsochrobactrum sp. TDYN1]|uniref:Outer membrane lipoprotein carrier protein LolA n=1 Tax=Falsochrobactrum tianjinense TaxID=2706015 RepID=A0A949PKL4_9HYPH|nr:outer membrane lipoprotein carrier protein LolA [Falsochrobactrum sp. TDYN1]MBV2141949.1 outer membrane lipoprotein carrier protein LolA [Falsochrobactrum sp. TDYN1]